MRDFLTDAIEPPARLEVSGLKLQRSGKILLDVPQLCLEGAGPTLILGPNGAGKSLLLRCLHGLVRPDQGQIRQNGLGLGSGPADGQAMVFQTPVLLRRSVAANLDYVVRRQGISRAQRKLRIAALLSEGGLADKANQSARSLSGGEAQRLAIMRALALEPQILFLDEPTSALDPAATQSIETLILRASARGTRIVMVTHDVSQAQRLGRDIILMQGGRVVEHATVGDFFTKPTNLATLRFLAGELII